MMTQKRCLIKRQHITESEVTTFLLVLCQTLHLEKQKIIHHPYLLFLLLRLLKNIT